MTPTIDDAALDDYRQALHDLPELCALLPAALTLRTPSPGRTAPTSKPPLRLDILQLADTRDRTRWLDGMQWCDPDSVGILPYLWGWARDLEATALDTAPGLTPDLPATPTAVNIAEWLLETAEWAATLPQWPELHSGILHCWRAAKTALSALREPETRPVPCSRCRQGHLQRIDGTTPAWQCNLCGHEVRIQAVTLKQAAQHVNMPYTTLRDWARRPGLLAPIEDSPRRRLYDLGQIRALAAERRLRSHT